MRVFCDKCGSIQSLTRRNCGDCGALLIQPRRLALVDIELDHRLVDNKDDLVDDVEPVRHLRWSLDRQYLIVTRPIRKRMPTSRIGRRSFAGLAVFVLLTIISVYVR